MEYQELIEKRYSVRSFDKEAAVSEDQINAILEAGRLAPTAKNIQSQRLYVVAEPAMLRKIDAATQCRNGATCAIIVGFSNGESVSHSDFSPYDKWGFGEQDAANAMNYMMLKAVDLGLGTLWVGAYDTRVLKREFDLPTDFQARAILMIGVPAEDCEPSEDHVVRKPLDEIVTRIKAPETPSAPVEQSATVSGDDRAAARAARRAARAASRGE